jgi:ferrous iron transport protein B
MSNPAQPKLIALAGTPNVGKTTVFNQLTGLNQKVGNYPGITVDKKTGKLRGHGATASIIDLPGTYNLFPRSEDEQVVFRVLCGLEKGIEVDAILAVVDSSNLERGLFLVTQLIDLGYPVAVVLNMEDQARKEGLQINKSLLERLLGIPIFTATADKGIGIEDIKKGMLDGRFRKGKTFINIGELCDENLLLETIKNTSQPNAYRALQVLKFRNEDKSMRANLKEKLDELASSFGFNSSTAQRMETKLRYEAIRELLAKCLKETDQKKLNFTRKLDAVFLHKTWGFLIFMALLFLIFQAIFSWAEGPMDFIDSTFAELGNLVATNLPSGVLTDLLSEGVIPGLGGIVIFVPQIALLFAFLAILEASGYMARAVFITDKVMRPFGLNGRSVVPLISGFACAIPAIMAARNISNKKDKLITIFVTPFMSCSARLPVYIVLIGLIFPEESTGFFNPRGTALFFMYFLGIAAALASAWALKFVMRRERAGNLVLELPRYRWPNAKSVLITMYEKSKTFVVEAGKIILAISIILWVLASYGPGNSMEEAVASVPIPEAITPENLSEYREKVATAELEASYAGSLGRLIEPAIEPLGYDWKIGISLVTSFAAREVFVSTMATLYSIGDGGEDVQTIRQKLLQEKNDQGQPMFSSAVVWSLLVFYAFAMQCMSTVAVVYRETKSIKWPLVQTVFMTAVAYLAALIVYQVLS